MHHQAAHHHLTTAIVVEVNSLRSVVLVDFLEVIMDNNNISNNHLKDMDIISHLKDMVDMARRHLSKDMVVMVRHLLNKGTVDTVAVTEVLLVVVSVFCRPHYS